MRFKLLDLTGRVFGSLTVLELSGRRRYPNQTVPVWRCLCVCGNERNVESGKLLAKSSPVLSCGCKRAVPRGGWSAINQIHGDSGTPEHRAWASMRTRCLRSTYRFFKNYGGRGIRICAAWSSYATFLADMGRRPSPKHSLDRKKQRWTLLMREVPGVHRERLVVELSLGNNDSSAA